ncbi:ankyrin repeat-containing domain protein [Xylaria cf. heliscus]|nr:ankyrin repeat-containing domain protein [Xylaria cf. heliscus]
MLLDAGAPLAMASVDDSHHFVQIAILGRSEVVKLLLEHGYPRTPLDSTNNEFLLHHLTCEKETNTMDILLNHAPSGTFTAALLVEHAHFMLSTDNTSMLRLFLRLFLHRGDIDLDAESTKEGFGTALQECAYHGNLKMAKVLMAHQRGVAVNKQQGRYHNAIMASVCRQEKPGRAQYRRQCKMIRYLLDNGAIMTTRGGSYGTILNAAAACASRDLLKFLIVDIQLPAKWIDHEGRTPVHMACMSSCEPREKLDYLITETTLNSRFLRFADTQSRTPFHFACGHGNLSAIKYLSSHKALRIDSFNKADDDNWTALHWACRQRNNEVVKFLINALHVDTTLKTSDGWTAWDVAVFHGNDHLADVLGVQKAKMKNIPEDKIPETLSEPDTSKKPPFTTERQHTQKGMTLLGEKRPGEDDGQKAQPSEGNVEFDELMDVDEENADDEEPPTKPECSSCFIKIFGNLWACDGCMDFYLCFKCQRHSSLHSHYNPGHNFSIDIQDR